MTPRVHPASLLLLGTFLLLLTVGLAAQQVHVWAGLVITEIVLLALPTWLVARASGRPPAVVLGLQRPTDGRFGLSLNVAGAVGPLSSLMAMGLTLPVVFLLVLAGARYPGVGLPLDGWSDFAAALVTGAILAPLCEEMLFRGFVLQTWRPGGAHAAVWASAAAFGLFHADPVRFIPTASLGLVFGYLALYGGSIWPAVVAHAVNNGLALSAAFFLSGSDEAAAGGVSWETMRPELIKALRESGMSLSDGELESAARMMLIMLAGAFLAAGGVLALAVGLAVRSYARRALELAAAGGGGTRVLFATGGAGSGRGTSATPAGEPVNESWGRLAGRLLRDPAAWGFVVVGLGVWVLSLGVYFRG